MVKNPSEGKKKNKIFEQDLGLLETCLESVPSALIITVIWVRATGENLNKIFSVEINIILFVTEIKDGGLSNIIFNPDSHSLFTRIFFLPPTYGVALTEFLKTYAISIISAALGLAKCLKNGVARPIGPSGALDGLLSGKFILAFLACGGVLVTRGFCIAGFVLPNDPEVIFSTH